MVKEIRDCKLRQTENIRGHLCICVLGVSNLSLSTIFL